MINKIFSLNIWLKNNGFKKEAKNLNYLYKKAISYEVAENLEAWRNSDHSGLSFDNLFGERTRLILPFKTKEQLNILKIVKILKEKGWSIFGENNKFNYEFVKEKRSMGEGAGQEIVDVPIADLKLTKKIKRVIPKGPRKGEEITREITQTISKIIKDPKNEIPNNLVKWWNITQTKYAKDYSWREIESAFYKNKNNLNYAVIISREPIDVVRMSDHINIHSCHAEGQSYFDQAMAESRGHGPIAYLVKINELHEMLQTKDDIGNIYDDLDALTNIDKNLKKFDGKELFEDSKRRIPGIVPVARLRLRKYVNSKEDYEFTIPEVRVYGRNIPGFVNFVREWSWKSQKHLFELKDNEDINIPKLKDIKMYGGTYRDTNDSYLLSKFFKEGNIDAKYFGNAENVIEEGFDPSNTFDMWEKEINEIKKSAERDLEYVFFSADIEEGGDGQLYVWASVFAEYNIPLEGWTDITIDNGIVRSKDGFKEIPFNIWQSKELKTLLEDHFTDGIIEGIEVEKDDFMLRIQVGYQGENIWNPDDAERFYKNEAIDIDRGYNEVKENVKDTLISEGYIGKSSYDILKDRLTDEENANSEGANSFEHLKVNADRDSIDIYADIPIRLNLFKIFSSEKDDNTYELKKALNAEKDINQKWYLPEESKLVLDTINKINFDNYYYLKSQLYFDFAKQNEPILPIDLSSLLDEVKVYFYLSEDPPGLNSEITSIIINIKIKNNNPSIDLEQIDNLLNNLDNNLIVISKNIFKKLISKINNVAKEI